MYVHSADMKEHLKAYFPDRFPSSSLESPLNALSPRARAKLTCENIVNNAFEKSDEIQLLVGAMRKYGCNFNLRRHVSCETCKGCNGGYDPDTNQIVICYNITTNKNKILTTLVHEMIHMFDYCRAEFDFDNIAHVACTEIRAANLTHCDLLDKFQFGNTGLLEFKRAHRECVRDVAFRSVKAYAPDTDANIVADTVNRVFTGCYNDLEPFGRRPTSGMRDMKHSYRERFYYGYI